MRKNNDPKHSKSLESLQNGKATESVLMSFNQREYELLNRAFDYVPNIRSRHAWIHDVIMNEVRKVLKDDAELNINPETNLPEDEF